MKSCREGGRKGQTGKEDFTGGGGGAIAEHPGLMEPSPIPRREDCPLFKVHFQGHRDSAISFKQTFLSFQQAQKDLEIQV